MCITFTWWTERTIDCRRIMCPPIRGGASFSNPSCRQVPCAYTTVSGRPRGLCCTKRMSLRVRPSIRRRIDVWLQRSLCRERCLEFCHFQGQKPQIRRGAASIEAKAGGTDRSCRSSTYPEGLHESTAPRAPLGCSLPQLYVYARPCV
ncbi:hypothetical protein DICSQDRAFT_152473 [Dichomitus squalens LYAD-421 SS1]|uniref:uncharacterized protein n=1 Tax=Dichomitus squalens (strain LYAD-421) TaxID=732165 RepID=UPI0004411AE8|nr:uncharacterized protein DICSQDRAFT_152473 [Dichomitus squalens LYAD-421 SS1]EJF65218.1 hypothetical protein DICSQDRAFT_152473 [Dichomitus squalens LYAD-421 SS1]